MTEERIHVIVNPYMLLALTGGDKCFGMINMLVCAVLTGNLFAGTMVLQ